MAVRNTAARQASALIPLQPAVTRAEERRGFLLTGWIAACASINRVAIKSLEALNSQREFGDLQPEAQNEKMLKEKWTKRLVCVQAAGRMAIRVFMYCD